MVWFCHWFKSALPWFVLFSALQLCALCAASGAHLSLPLLDTLCQTSRKPSRQKVANVFLLLAWRAEQGQQDNYAKPAAEAPVVWAGVIPADGWATEQLTAAGKSVPRTGVMPPRGLGQPVELRLFHTEIPRVFLVMGLSDLPEITETGSSRPQIPN